jgi:hypothetical protein
MLSQDSKTVAEQAKAFYASELREKLEAESPGRHVAIEPNSREFFVEDSFGDAVRAARTAHPDRIAFVIRIGHKAAIHLGGISH